MSTGGHIRARGPGAWELKNDIGRDPKTGRRITRYKTLRGRKSDAQRELRNLLGAVDRGVVADAGKLTTGQWLEQWLAECKHTVALRPGKNGMRTYVCIWYRRWARSSWSSSPRRTSRLTTAPRSPRGASTAPAGYRRDRAPS